jgi:DNA polymerase-3 subunit gamma/tau
MPGLFADAPDESLPPAPDGPGLFGDAAPRTAPAPAPGVAPPPAYRVLARKYRPTGFDDLIGQDAMVRTLRNAFASGRIAHAFMLTGVRGVGKTTTARIIARCLNCIGPDGTGGPTASPCGVCAECTAILADRHPDVVEMDAASNTGVDDVREIIEATRFRPLQARTKVFIIDEVHMLSRNAFNALLKTLEEPPPHVKFVFATTELRKVPITVLSRCQRFDLRRIGVAELVAQYARIAAREGVAIEPAALATIARAADGSVRDGLSILDQAIAQGDGASVTGQAVADMLGLADREIVFELLETVLSGRTAQALALTERAHERGADLGAVLGDLLELVHTLTRLKTVPGLADSPDLPELERTRGAALAAALSIPVLARAWQLLLKGTTEVEAAPDRRAAADMVLIRLAYVAELPTPGELVRRLTESGPPPRPPDGGGTRAMVATGGGGAALARAAPSLDAAPALPANFRDVVALAGARREARLHGYLVDAAHLVRYAPPVIELRLEPEAPRDLAQRLAAVLQAETGQRWTIALVTAGGEPTLREQAEVADSLRRAEAADDTLVRAILDAFPGARIERVDDPSLDAYGLPQAELQATELQTEDAVAEEPQEIDP